MIITIPEELQPFVRMSKKEGLVAYPEMPEELNALFEETKKWVLELNAKRKAELENLIK